ncbi:HesA/MoeB/ThiF family protein [Candidatus Woesearchaeota archaeon]|nr:MAG: HesA/MoeB/ThiF family protein [Candidatus Woesearchaeota archaeon]
MAHVSRYSCQTNISWFGEQSQRRISSSSVAVVGLGALGSCSAELLCRMGIGTLILIDFDVVDLKNLHRQTLYTESDVGKPKVLSAKEHLSKINSEIELAAFPKMLSSENSSELLGKADLVIDCTDNMEARREINRWAVSHSMPWVHAACVKTSGSVMSFLPGGPCFECVFSDKSSPDSCSSAGILPQAASFVSSVQVSEALKVLLGKATSGTLIRADVWNYSLEKFSVKKKKSCPACSQ